MEFPCLTRLPNSQAGRLDQRPVVVVGRRARLELVFGCRRGRTILAHLYTEPPFRVLRLLDFGEYVQVILICSGPGVFGGDRLEQSVHVESGARVLLVSQSALQIHPSSSGHPANLQSHYTVHEGGELDCFWDAAIPFAGSRLKQQIDIDVKEGSRLLWSDALMAGRIGHGERWRFEELGHELRLSVDGSLKYLERYRLSPESRAVVRDWMAGSADYLGTVLAQHPVATALIAERLHHELTTLAGVHSGVDCLAPGLLVGRLLATRGPQFSASRAIIRAGLARPPLRKL